jgi:hypothetical protein
LLKLKGNVAETAVMYALSQLGLPVFKEVGDSCAVDLITLVNKRPVLIQAKYAEVGDNGSVALYLRTTGPGGYAYYYKRDDLDLFALYINDTKQVVWIHIDDALQNKATIRFRSRDSKNNQEAKTRRIEDYLDFYAAVSYASVV